MAEGLDYVYVGNVPGHPGNNTYCPGCGEPVMIPEPDVPADEIDGDLLYEALGDPSGAPDEVKCPNCDRPMPVNGVVTLTV